MTDRERFAAKCRRQGTHTIWTGGCQFRFHDGWRCSPTQAAYLLRGGRSLRPGEAVWRTCKVAGCVAHVQHGTLQQLAEVHNSRRRHLDTKTARYIRSLPSMRGTRGQVAALAERFGTSVGIIHRLRNRWERKAYREARP